MNGKTGEKGKPSIGVGQRTRRFGKNEYRKYRRTDTARDAIQGERNSWREDLRTKSDNTRMGLFGNLRVKGARDDP